MPIFGLKIMFKEFVIFQNGGLGKDYYNNPWLELI